MTRFHPVPVLQEGALGNGLAALTGDGVRSAFTRLRLPMRVEGVPASIVKAELRVVDGKVTIVGFVVLDDPASAPLPPDAFSIGSTASGQGVTSP